MYKVVNKDLEKSFTGKGLEYTMTQVLDLYDSLGGTAAGYSVVKI